MLNKMERQHITISQFLAVGEAYKAIRSDLVRYTGNAGSSEENFFLFLRPWYLTVVDEKDGLDGFVGDGRRRLFT